MNLAVNVNEVIKPEETKLDILAQDTKVNEMFKIKTDENYNTLAQPEEYLTNIINF